MENRKKLGGGCNGGSVMERRLTKGGAMAAA